MISNERGYSTVEAVFVLVLLVLFGLTAFTLVTSGADSFGRTLETRDENANMRIAASFITTKLRQNDVVGSVSVINEGGVNALVLTEKTRNGEYDTYVYHYNGALCELVQPSGFEFNPEAGWVISEVSGVTFSCEDDAGGRCRAVSAGLDYMYRGEKRHTSLLVMIRSGNLAA